MSTADIPTTRDVMTRFRVKLSPDTPLPVALKKMVAKRSLGAPVEDGSRRVVGVLTVKDCLRLVVDYSPRFLADQKVEDHMSTLKGTLTLDMDLFTIAETFLQSNFPVLPVLRDGRLVGRVSRLEVLREILELERRTQHQRRRQAAEIQDRTCPTSIESMQNLAASHTPEQLAEVMRNRPRYRK